MHAHRPKITHVRRCTIGYYMSILHAPSQHYLFAIISAWFKKNNNKKLLIGQDAFLIWADMNWLSPCTVVIELCIQNKLTNWFSTPKFRTSIQFGGPKPDISRQILLCAADLWRFLAAWWHLTVSSWPYPRPLPPLPSLPTTPRNVTLVLTDSQSILEVSRLASHSHRRRCQVTIDNRKKEWRRKGKQSS